jgi:hypothetical protein
MKSRNFSSKIESGIKQVSDQSQTWDFEIQLCKKLGGRMTVVMNDMMQKSLVKEFFTRLPNETNEFGMSVEYTPRFLNCCYANGESPLNFDLFGPKQSMCSQVYFPNYLI